MNERDLKLEAALASQLGVDGNDYIFTTKRVFLVRINLVILKLLLEDKKKRGITVVLDRPHGYLTHLLTLHKVDQTNLLYADTVTKLSSSVPIEIQENVIYTNGPFHLDLLLNLFLDGQIDDSQTAKTDLDDIDFILIDNIATALAYNTMTSVENFLRTLRELISTKNILFVAGIDADAHKTLYWLLKRYITNEIKIEERWLHG